MGQDDAMRGWLTHAEAGELLRLPAERVTELVRLRILRRAGGGVSIRSLAEYAAGAILHRLSRERDGD